MTVSEMITQLNTLFAYVSPLNLTTEEKPGLLGPFYFNVIKQTGDTQNMRAIGA